MSSLMTTARLTGLLLAALLHPCLCHATAAAPAAGANWRMDRECSSLVV